MSLMKKEVVGSKCRVGNVCSGLFSSRRLGSAVVVVVELRQLIKQL